MNLYPYQNNTVAALRKSILAGHKRICLVSPTGSGKTVMFSFLINEHLKKGGKVLILSDRTELLKQSTRAFNNIPEIKANHEPDLTKRNITGMIETFMRRVDRYHNYIQTLTMIVLDESHKCCFDKLFPHINPNTIVLGCTATCLRTGKQEPMDSFYTDIVQIIDTPELVEQGFLSKCVTYGVDIDLKGVKMKGDDYDANDMAKMYSENKVYEGVVENYKRICPGTKAILFASNVESSKEVCLQFNLAGIPAKHLDSDKKTISDKERKEIFEWFKNTPNGVLCNVNIATTGFDEPTIETVILYRATKSLILFMQAVGRGSRIIKGVKNTFTLLDFGENVKTHNFWQAPRTWSLSKKPKKEKVDAAPVKICPECHAMLPVSLAECSFCGFVFKKEASGKNEFAELRLLTPPEIWIHTKKAPISEKVRLAKAKMVKSMAVLHTLETKEEGLQFCNEMGYDKRFPYINRHRFKCFESL